MTICTEEGPINASQQQLQVQPEVQGNHASLPHGTSTMHAALKGIQQQSTARMCRSAIVQ